MPPLDVGSGTIQAAWLARAARRDPLDVGLLVRTMTETQGRYAVKRLEHFVDEPADPRLLRALQRHLRHSPFPSRRASDPYCLLAVDLLLATDDPESHELLAQLMLQNAGVQRPLGRKVSDHLRLRGHRIKVLPAPRLDRQVTRACAEVCELAAQASPAPANVSELFAAVYAAPQDVAPRAILADALTGLGDPRGEFIALQLRGGSPAAEQRLLKQYERDWLGALEPIAARAGNVWKAGFLDTLRLGLRYGDTAQHAAHPEWATVTCLDVSSFEFGELLPLFFSPQAKQLDAVVGLRGQDLAHLLTAGRPIPWTRLVGIHGVLPAELPQRLEFVGAPNLRELDIIGLATPDQAWLEALARAAPVRRVDVGVTTIDWPIYTTLPGSIEDLWLFDDNGLGGRHRWGLGFDGSATVRARYNGGRRGEDPPAQLAALLTAESVPFEVLQLVPGAKLAKRLDWTVVVEQARRLGLTLVGFPA